MTQFSGTVRRDATRPRRTARSGASWSPWPPIATLAALRPTAPGSSRVLRSCRAASFVVEREPAGRLGASRAAPRVRGRQGSMDKRPWNQVTPPAGPVEVEFLRPLLLGESVAPFRLLDTALAVIPVEGRRCWMPTRPPAPAIASCAPGCATSRRSGPLTHRGGRRLAANDAAAADRPHAQAVTTTRSTRAKGRLHEPARGLAPLSSKIRVSSLITRPIGRRSAAGRGALSLRHHQQRHCAPARHPDAVARLARPARLRQSGLGAADPGVRRQPRAASPSLPRRPPRPRPSRPRSRCPKATTGASAARSATRSRAPAWPHVWKRWSPGS